MITSNSPIGVFDSGVGGLSCIEALRRALPADNFIYFGDTARAPYGCRSTEEIKQFSGEIADLLTEKGCKALAIACNTISCVALDYLREKHPELPITGIVKPAAESIAKKFKEKRIGVIATPATICSGAYPEEIHRISPEAAVFSLAVPVFVEMVEAGKTSAPEADIIVKSVLSGFVQENSLDVIVLGCTHFPHLENNISRCFPNITIINPASELAFANRKALEAYGLNKPDTAHQADRSKDIFLASREDEVFTKYVTPLLG